MNFYISLDEPWCIYLGLVYRETKKYQEYVDDKWEDGPKQVNKEELQGLVQDRKPASGGKLSSYVLCVSCMYEN